jgi:hypothetical protein
MIQKQTVANDRNGQLFVTAIGLASIVACTSPHAAEAPRPNPTRPVSGTTNAQPDPTEESIILTKFLTSSGSTHQTLGPSITKSMNELFDPLFMSVLKEHGNFNCFKGGCFQKTVVADLTTVERLDQAILSPHSGFMGLPGIVHRGAPIKLTGGGYEIVWTMLITENEYSMLVATMKADGRTDKRKQ